MQLAGPRIGWENEHLASYLLSQIAFVANPITIGDDIGADFLCTLFEPKKSDGQRMLFPIRSFAIQIKSNNARWPATNKIEYLKGLELPFFMGVVERSKLSLSIYSGEYLPIKFTQYGIPSKLTLCPVEASELDVSDASVNTKESLEIKLPLAVKLAATDDEVTRERNRRHLDDLCARMHANISTRVSKEYIYKLDAEGTVQIQAGSASVETFRYNLYLRLAEAFYNLEWLLEERPDEFSREEFEDYAAFYRTLSSNHVNLPTILVRIFEKLHKRIATKDAGST